MNELSTLFNFAAQAGAFIGVGIVTLAALKSSLFKNNQNEETLITRFGKHVRTVTEPGLKMKIPFIDAIAARLPVAKQYQAEEMLETKTKDDLFVKLPITIQYTIGDTKKFFFQNNNAVENMKKVVSAAVRTATAGKDFQELYGDRDEISNAVIEHVINATEEFGLHIRRIIIDQPTAPAEVQASFNEVRASERLKEAARNKADSHAIEVIAKAQAEKEADILRGQGKAGFRREIFAQYSEQVKQLSLDGTERERALDAMQNAMQQDTLRDIGEKGNLIIVIESGNKDIGSRLAELQTLRHTPAAEQNNGGAAKLAAPAI